MESQDVAKLIVILTTFIDFTIIIIREINYEKYFIQSKINAAKK